jgi:DNA polymerase III subunit epsilon
MFWHETTSWVGFDLETTGTSVLEDRAVTATVIHEHHGLRDTHEWLINPGIPIPEEATEIHGISTEYAEERGLCPSAAIPAILKFLGDLAGEDCPLVAFNAAFDLSLLRVEAIRYGIAVPRTWAPVLDPMVIDWALDRYRPGKKTLGLTCPVYGVDLVDAHQSTGDANATLDLIQAMGKRSQLSPKELRSLYRAQRYPERVAAGWTKLATATLPELHNWQINWAAERETSYRAYLAKVGKTIESDDGVGWPVRE